MRRGGVEWFSCCSTTLLREKGGRKKDSYRNEDEDGILLESA